MATTRGLPSGAVTLVFTDIEGSTRLLQAHGEHYGDVLARHHELLCAVWARHHGIDMGAAGDGRFAVFRAARPALHAARDAQRELARERWPAGIAVHVRIGVHTGEARVQGGLYWGEDVHYAARICDAGHGGQVVVSAATASLVSGAELVDLGEHRVKDFPIPRRLYQLGAERHPPLRTLDPLRSNLPSSPGALIGRDAQRAELARLLGPCGCRLVTITGAGGTGKTRLALAVAEAMMGELADGAFFVGLAEVTTPEGALTEIATHVGVRVSTGADAVTSLAAALADRRLLLVLDNFEHLLAAGPLVSTLLAAAPGLRVLVTSQAPLRLAGERVSGLGPLETPRADDAASLEQSPAGRLLLDRARDALPGFALSATNAGALARLCRALDGMPLALELAAARLAVLSPVDLLSRLERGLDALGRGWRDLPARQRGLRAALEWTTGLLDADAARLLRRLGAFAGAASLERIERICVDDGADALEPLARLVDLSLVRHAGDGRFALHASVRAYAREQLAEHGESENMARRHAVAFADAAHGWGRRYLLDVAAVQAVVAAEEPDIAEALSWAAREDDACFARLAGGSALALMFAARLGDWRERIAEVRARGTVTGEAGVWLALASALAALSGEDLAFAMAEVSEAVAAADALGDPRLGCLIRTCSIVMQFLTDAIDDVDARYDELRRGAAALGDPDIVALVDGLAPYVLAYCGDQWQPALIVEAEPMLLALLRARTRTDFPAHIAGYYWPDCLIAKRDFASALGAYTAALATARERADPLGIAYQLEGIAISLAYVGRPTEAFQAFGWSESARQASGRIVDESWKLLLEDALARARAEVGEPGAQAAYAHGRAMSLDAAVNAALSLDHAPAVGVAGGGAAPVA